MIRTRKQLCLIADDVFSTAFDVIVKSGAAQTIEGHWRETSAWRGPQDNRDQLHGDRGLGRAAGPVSDGAALQSARRDGHHR